VAKDQATKIQILSVKHLDLLQVVDRMFDKFATLKQVQVKIERTYHEDIALTSIRTYKRKHWKLQKDMVREQKATMKAIAEIIGEDGLTAGVNALLWQALQTMTPPQLITFKKVLSDGEKVELMKEQFALVAEEHRQKMKEPGAGMKAAKDGSEAGDAAEDYAKAQRVVAQVKEIFGIGLTGIEPPGPPRLGAG
jgi:hypothetical protein